MQKLKLTMFVTITELHRTANGEIRRARRYLVPQTGAIIDDVSGPSDVTNWKISRIGPNGQFTSSHASAEAALAALQREQ